MVRQTAPDDDLLVGDTERTAAEIHLREACVAGRLTLAEFSTRMDSALAARTHRQLRVVIQDLPALPLAPTRSVATSPIVAILGEHKRSGRWRVEGQVDILAVMGSCAIDLRHAEIIGSEVNLNVRAIMADVKIFVPRGLQVVVEGLSILSSSKVLRAGDPPLPESPVVRVRGISLISSVEVTDDDPRMR
ncbi:MAG: DUF1707 SHOCT-like domain-containing protein [Dehalococcoidia bacterium]